MELGNASKHTRARWIRDGDFKLVVPGPAKPPIPSSLLDLHTDPHEHSNLVSQPDADRHAKRMTHMRQLLDNWCSSQMPTDTSSDKWASLPMLERVSSQQSLIARSIRKRRTSSPARRCQRPRGQRRPPGRMAMLGEPTYWTLLAARWSITTPGTDADRTITSRSAPWTGTASTNRPAHQRSAHQFARASAIGTTMVSVFLSSSSAFIRVDPWLRGSSGRHVDSDRRLDGHGAKQPGLH